MAYEKQEWRDHIAEYPGRVKIVEDSSGEQRVVRDEGEVIQQATPVTANRMHHIEDGISNAHETADTAKGMAASLTVKVAVMMGAQFGGISGNMIVEDMSDTSRMHIERGVYDQEGRRLYAKSANGDDVILLGYGIAYE